jgi:hypothetical protein
MTPLQKIFLARQQASMQSCSHAAQGKNSGGVIELGLSLRLYEDTRMGT